MGNAVRKAARASSEGDEVSEAETGLDSGVGEGAESGPGEVGNCRERDSGIIVDARFPRAPVGTGAAGAGAAGVVAVAAGEGRGSLSLVVSAVATRARCLALDWAS